MAASIQERKRMGEIVERNKLAQVTAHKLRRELKELMEEATKMGLLDRGDEEEEEEKEEEEDVMGDFSQKHPLEV